jgi:hypothetical protein
MNFTTRPALSPPRFVLERGCRRDDTCGCGSFFSVYCE